MGLKKWLGRKINALSVAGYDTDSPKEIQRGGPNDNFLIDIAGSLWRGNGITLEDNSGESESVKSQRIEITPIEVLDQLTMEPRHIDTENIDARIDMIERRKNLIVDQYYSSTELEGAIQLLKNRKKYEEHREYFTQFDITTKEKIDELLKKYALVMNSSDLFIPSLPDEAIEKIEKFQEITNEICEKKAHISIIAEEKHFQMAYDRRDPIVLAQSPFGYYFYILGAYDNEVALLPEL